MIDLLPGEPSGKNVDHVALVLDPSIDLEQLVASGDFDLRAGPMRIWGAQGYGMGIYVADPDGHVIELKSYRALPVMCTVGVQLRLLPALASSSGTPRELEREISGSWTVSSVG